MNIFASSTSPIRSARFLDDKRVVKMILESAQLLSTAAAVHQLPAPYGPAFRRHPCAQWSALNSGNYDWLFDHFCALLAEYTYRYGKQHKCAAFIPLLQLNVHKLPHGRRSKFADCSGMRLKTLLAQDFQQMPPEQQQICIALATATHLTSIWHANMEQRYVLCLLLKWQHDVRRPTWKHRRVPLVYQRYRNLLQFE